MVNAGDIIQGGDTNNHELKELLGSVAKIRLIKITKYYHSKTLTKIIGK